jgi:cytochrome c2
MRRALIVALLLTGCQQYPAPGNVRSPSFAFASQTLALPEEASKLADTAAGELVTSNCAACHSVDQIQYQPRLKPEQWAATVKKMRDVYHAPISAADDAKLVAALVELQSPAR